MTDTTFQLRGKLPIVHWLGVAALCVAAIPLMMFIDEGLRADLKFDIVTLELVLTFSLVASAAGFLSGPLTLAWCTYLAGTMLLIGLSEDRQYFLCCTSKDRFEAAVFALIPVFMFPGSAASSYFLGSKIFLKRVPRPTIAAMIVVLSALSAFGASMYFDYLEKHVPCPVVRCNF